MARHPDTVYKDRAQTIPYPGVSVVVRNYASPQALAAITDDNGTAIPGSTVTTDSLGAFAFNAASGEYLLQFVVGGVVKWDQHVTLGQEGADAVDFTPAGVGAIARSVQAKLRERVSVKDFGVVGDGVTDDTAAIHLARNYVKGTGATLHIPAATYLIGEVLFDGSNYRIECDHGVTFKQKSGLTPDTDNHPSIKISGTDISLLGSIKFTGNIATDTGEWRACVFVDAGSKRIQIGRLYGTDIRGDVFTQFGTVDSPTYGIEVESVSGSNVYRNLAGVIGGQVKFGSIINDGPVGFRELHVEPNAGGFYQPANVQFDYLKCGSSEIISADTTLQNEWFGGGVIEADGTLVQATTPPYPSAPGANAYGFGYTLCKAGHIGHLILRNYQSYPVNFGASTLKSKLRIDKVSFANCATSGTLAANDKAIFREPLGNGMAFLDIGSIEGAHYSSSHRLVAAQPGFVVRIGHDATTGGISTGLIGAGLNAIPSAATLVIPAGRKVIPVSGTTNITEILAGDERADWNFTLVFQGVLTVTDGGNLKLNGNFTTAAGSTLTLCGDGANFYEIARSSN